MESSELMVSDAVKMKKPVLYMAPLRGVTDAIFRQTFARYFDGFDLAVAPFIPTRNVKRIKPNTLKDVLPETNQAIPVIPQLLSKDPDEFILFANALYDLGYTSVNWNLGCPYPMVAKKMRGSGLLEYPDKIDAFLDKVIPAIGNRLSIKTRLGRKQPDEIFQLIPIFNRYPLESIVIHPRTGIQMYDGTVDIEVFAQCLGMIRHRVVYNGDIVDLAGFQALSRRFPDVRHWMIGRGAIANPFLSGVIQQGQDNRPDKIPIIQEFIQDLYQAYRQVMAGPSHPLDRMKGLWGYFAKSFKNGDKILKAIRKNRNPERYIELTDQFFEETQWKDP